MRYLKIDDILTVSFVMNFHQQLQFTGKPQATTSLWLVNYVAFTSESADANRQAQRTAMPGKIPTSHGKPTF